MTSADVPARPLVLVVDDEPFIAHLLALALRQEGYDVVTAHGGEEALAVFGRLPNIALVIMDLAMDGMAGTQALARMQEMRPSIRCCFITGQHDDLLDEELLRRGGAAVIRKPFDLAGIGGAIRQWLSPPAGTTG
jgi:CheY-like chemotaxis protein